ncbi:leucine-rich repeats and immunoglobulin-like domains protein 3 [Paramacrobiotus metropolitanus]|uniref:leucine-rich repeats and immunoglobulin-like domains protein 3 n=1 Tax=Paramacrobiotus metropolitanus TaxID=2943436 RepID=UPI002445FB10|nr:leucine-rich repeats and immunoglobulin-like domains protein 3 [Paramacrobiotus metropolitanus]
MAKSILWAWTSRVLWKTRWILIIEILVLWETLFINGVYAGESCPRECSCLGPFVDCTYRSLTDIPRDLPVWTEVLHLQHNFITNVRNGSLKNLINLDEIDLGNNLLTNMSSLLLELPSSIRKVNINNNKMLDAVIPVEMPQLTQLNLRSNNIFQLRSLRAALNLDALDLSDNQLKNLNPTLSDNTTIWPTSLTKLKLNHNRITTITKEMFKSLSAIQSLELNDNDISDIDGLAFHGLTSLTTLNLENNDIKSLNDGAFWGLSSLKTLYLQNNKISSIRKGWLYGLDALQILNISRNAISRIDDSAWEFSRDITQLDLSSNALAIINKTTFTPAGNLMFLNLSANAIVHISEESMKQLRRLITLDLSDNQVGPTLESPTSVFGWLKSLQMLYLRRTGAVMLSGHAFGGLKQLQELDLSGNEISSAEPDAFRGLSSLHNLKLNTSSFICDCDISGFLHLVQTRSYPDAHFSCFFPPELRGKELRSLTPGQLKCYDKPRPKIESDPESRVVVVGSNITIQCSASFPTDSAAIIRWKKDDTPVANAITTTTARLNGSVMVYVSKLTIPQTERSNSGNYQCIATNNFGTVYSSKAKVAVHVFPVFVKHPQDITVRAGATARLECSATGTPRPQVRWKKNGGTTDFPAARQRRLRYETGSDVMHIVNVSREDTGVYSCIASNAAGSVMANATLAISDGIGVNLVTDSANTKLLNVGESALFECDQTLRGERFAWLKNGVMLLLTQRHHLLRDGRLLVISELMDGDSGIYQCEADGAEGYDMGPVYTLRVKRKPSAWWDMDDNTKQNWIIAVTVIASILITSLAFLVYIYCTRRKRRGVSSAATEETMLPDECNPINGLHPSDSSLDSPVTDYTEYTTVDSVDEAFPTDRSGRNRIYSHRAYPSMDAYNDESYVESPSFASYATLKPAKSNKTYHASPHRSCSTIPRRIP